MPLNLMYITNEPAVASIAQEAGVNRIFVDMEYIGKELRQAGMNTVKSCHTFADISAIAPITRKGTADLLVRVNPIHTATKEYCSSQEEINTAIDCGADIVMLPMFKTCREVDEFVSAVNGRAKAMLLLETREAAEHIDDILSVGGFDELHIGLNDLHLAYKRKFMFELLADGTIDHLCAKLRTRNITFGFGGIARIGCGTLPAELIIAEHYRLGSRAAILSRSFCNASHIQDINKLKGLFIKGIRGIRSFEEEASLYSSERLAANKQRIIELVHQIVNGQS